MFNVEKFMKAKYSQRTQDVSMPNLAEFFGPDEKPVFKVRALEGEELGRVNEASTKLKHLAEIAAGLLSDSAKDNIEAIREGLGITTDLPADIARRLTMLEIACVKPKIKLEVAVKLCKVAPVDFFHVTNIIKDLTGQGSSLGK